MTVTIDELLIEVQPPGAAAAAAGAPDAPKPQEPLSAWSQKEMLAERALRLQAD